ncbi:DUF2252 domain-containing protein [Marinobacterium lutimaris]|uniref:Uncharacterized conserved protein, DUF2252 family n=1 Tax=Marinobacterium lutimaris TaxID=568106 RepID=A0A1H5WGE6_9GAMM|nr:DUF2252 family protein [Marinobacterium lutimaris]SEF98515.1 Uncharacterized conserved protein, DUF2252 family [Marinobacterium lutimaris]
MSSAFAHDRASQVITALEKFNAGLEPSLRQEKYAKMADSAFSFFRGSNHLYWRDVYRDWHFSLYGGSCQTQTWLLGDAHLLNFGAYGSHDEVVRYGLDDFDDAFVGDYQYDLWRLGISLVLAMEEEGKSRDSIVKALEALAKSYLDALSRDDELRGWVATPDSAEGLLGDFLHKLVDKKSRARMLDKWTSVDDEGRRYFSADHPKLELLPAEVKSRLVEALVAYQESLDDEVPGHSHQHFKVKDVARRTGAGIGSLGNDRYYALIDSGEDGEDVILDIKVQQAPAVIAVLSDREQAGYASLYRHEAERHGLAFKALAHNPDPYVGWLSFDGQVFSVRERSPFKADFPLDTLSKGKEWREMAANWASILAASHLRGAMALGCASFATAVLDKAEDLAGFTGLFVETCLGYARCAHRDYEVLLGCLEDS